MAVDREGLFVALFNRLQAQLGNTIQSFSRRVTDWEQNAPPMRPALLLVKGSEHAQRKEIGTPFIWTLGAEIWVYVSDDGTGEAVPSTQLNQILTAIESALEIQPTEATAIGAQYLARRDGPPAGTTLGGLCLACEIGDTIDVIEGTQGHVGMVFIPVNIMVAA